MRKPALQEVVLFIVALVLSLFASSRTALAREKDVLTYGISGSVNPLTPVRRNPFSVIEKPKVQRLLLAVAQAPREEQFVKKALRGTGLTIDDLESIGLLRREKDRFVIGFALFTKAEVARVRQTAETYAESLAAAYATNWPQIEQALARYPVKTVDRKALAFILVGCFSLNWDGLDLTAEKGYRSTGREHPGGDRYLVWAEERDKFSFARIYWSSHDESFGDFALTSFGDRSFLRQAYPDRLWLMSILFKALDPPSSRDHMDFAEAFLRWRTATGVGRVMMALRDRPMTATEIDKAVYSHPGHTLEQLVGMRYLRKEKGRYVPLIPVLTREDGPMVEEVLRLSREIMASWLATNYDAIREKLGDLTPVKYGVPYNEVFTRAWHYIFGMANRRLVEAGFFADPYARQRKYKSFIPAVWHPSLSSHWMKFRQDSLGILHPENLP